MKCDMHVHTVHSGMCTVPVFDRFCRESYNDPDAGYGDAGGKQQHWRHRRVKQSQRHAFF